MSARSFIPLRALRNLAVCCLCLAPIAMASDRRGDSDKIRVHYTVKSWIESRLKDVRLDLDIHGRDASIEFHAPTGGNTQFEVLLEVPQNTNLDVHEKVGDLTVEDVEGDKDLELGVGDIRVQAAHSAYHLVRANTRIGDVDGEGYDETKGWLGQDPKVHRRWQIRTARSCRDRRHQAG